MFYTIGDSHSKHGWEEIPGVKVIHLGPKLCYSVGRDGLDIKTYGIKSGDKVCFCFGEIDCRAHVFTHSITKSYKDVIDEIVKAYIWVVIDNKNRIGIDALIYNVLPPIKDKYTSMALNPAFPFNGNEVERLKYIRYFNQCLEDTCKKNDITFVNIYNNVCDKDGYMQPFHSDGSVHIGHGAFLKKWVPKNYEPAPRILTPSTRLIFPNYPSTDQKHVSSLRKWADEYISYAKHFVEETVTGTTTIQCNNREKVTNEVLIFLGNFNAKTQKTLDLYEDYCKNKCKLERIYQTRVIWGVLEGTQLNDDIGNLECFDHVWTASDHVNEIIKPVIARSIVVPNGINNCVFNFETRFNTNNMIQSLPYDCKYLCVSTNTRRKNLHTLINAFTREFPGETPEACLIILVSDLKIPFFPNVFVIDYEINIDVLGEIMKSVNYLVSTSHSEGFCLPACEAISCGKRIIAPYYSGIKTFAHPDSVIQIPYKEVPIPSDVHDAFGKWADIKIEDVRSALRKANNEKNYLQKNGISSRFYWGEIALSTSIEHNQNSFMWHYVNQYMMKLHAFSSKIYNRSCTFYQAFDYIERRVLARKNQGKTTETHIIETGCTREAKCFSDGNSTIMFDHFVNIYGGKVTTIDIDPNNCKLCDDLTSDKVNVICSDSVKALHALPIETDDNHIDMIYLDSFDLDIKNPHLSAMHHLKELTAILPKLRTQTLILIDDHITEVHGKGKYISDFFKDLGITRYIDGVHQIGYIYDPNTI